MKYFFLPALLVATLVTIDSCKSAGNDEAHGAEAPVAAPPVDTATHTMTPEQTPATAPVDTVVAPPPASGVIGVSRHHYKMARKRYCECPPLKKRGKKSKKVATASHPAVPDAATDVPDAATDVPDAATDVPDAAIDAPAADDQVQ